MINNGLIHRKGFTIIEMMIALVIITVLAVVAVPTYRSYITKAKLTEAFTITANTKVAMVEYYNTHGHFPENNLDIGMKESPHSQYIKELNIKKPLHHSSEQTGYIELTLNNINQGIKDGEKMFFTASIDNIGGIVKWGCGTIDDNLLQYMPYDCIEIEQP